MMSTKLLSVVTPPSLDQISIITQIVFRMSSLQKNMVHSNSTANVGNSVLRIFNSHQKKNFEPFVEEMTDEYVEEDNMEVLLTDYSNWLSTTVIPKYFDEDI